MYFYCSPNDTDIAIRPQKEITPQEFRSRIFVSLFNRINNKFGENYILMTYIMGDDDTEKYYNHFISHKKHKNIVEDIENGLYDNNK